VSMALADLTRKASHRPTLPSFVPSFFPPFPTHQDSRLVVVAEQPQHASLLSSSTMTTSANSRATAADSTNQRPVRSALVKASQTTSTTVHWGSSWADVDETGTNDALVVPLGRPLPAGSGSASTETNTAATASIVPLNRASGSRVSRILEGSMDPPVL
jgi:hypothetical protein